MNIALGRKYRQRQRYLSTLLQNNPVLVQGLDLPFVIVCATTLKTSVAMSLELLLIHMVTMMAALITVRLLPPWSRVMVNVAVATITMTIARYLVTLIFPDLANYVSIYIYLMAVNGLTLYHSLGLNRKAKPLPVMAGAFMNVLSFFLTMVVVAVPREYFGSGTLWGVPLNPPIKLSGVSLVFGGFIIMAFFLAFIKFVNKKLLAFSILEAARKDARYIDLN